MVSKDLLEYVRAQQARGFRPAQIRGFLKRQGYTDEMLKPIFKELGIIPKKAIKPLILISGIIALLVIIGGGVLGAWYFAQPVCGNGKLEVGENPDTCCADAGCFGDYSCSDNECVAPLCGDCQFLFGSLCTDYECCSDEMCSRSETCEGNRCRQLECGTCQYVENHQCVDHECCEDTDCAVGALCNNNICEGVTCGACEYLQNRQCVPFACCANSDCDDGNNETVDVCSNAGSLNAVCENLLPDSCESNNDCDDNDDTTKDLCSGTPRVCSNELITSCIDDDNYCPSGCTSDDDDDCDECQIDSDCDDSNPATIDTCEDEPKECKNTLQTQCVDGDSYCPNNCDYTTDDDCEQPLGDLSISGVTLSSLGVDGLLYEPNCVNPQILYFDITHDFPYALDNIAVTFFVDGEDRTSEYTSLAVLREVGPTFDSSFEIGSSVGYVDVTKSLVGKVVALEISIPTLESDEDNNVGIYQGESGSVDYLLGPQSYNNASGNYEIQILRNPATTDCPVIDVEAVVGENILPSTFLGFSGDTGILEVTASNTTMTVSVDTNNVIEESNEGNNELSY